MNVYPDHVAFKRRDTPVTLSSHYLPKWDHLAPWCCFDPPARATMVIPLRDREKRREAHERRGLTFAQCGHPATHEIDGKAYCERHAGAVALKLLLLSNV